MKPSDHYKMVLHELTSVGVKPQIEKTGSGHLRISWAVEGARDFVICASTPSDWRSSLNERARIRRKLRATGIYDRVVAKPLPLAKALQVADDVDPLIARVEQLERDLGIMLELVSETAEIVAKEAYAAGWNGHAAAVDRALNAVRDPAPKPTKSVPVLSVSKPSEDTPPVPKPRTQAERVMAKLHYDKWLPAPEVAKLADIPTPSVYAVLSILKKKELVATCDQGWRLRAPKAVNETIAVPAPRVKREDHARLL